MAQLRDEFAKGAEVRQVGRQVGRSGQAEVRQVGAFSRIKSTGRGQQEGVRCILARISGNLSFISPFFSSSTILKSP
eukprot:2215735-Heterocapsa_arctica.AAC.1